MRCARRHTDGNITDAEGAHPVDGSESDARMLHDYALEHTLHFFLGEAFVSLVL